MPVFGDKENLPPQELLPESDQKFCVLEFDSGISTGGKTAGSECYKLKLQIEGKNRTVIENLIDHPTCAWKLDCFLKSAGIKLAKGEAFDFRKDRAEEQSVRWINPIGLRGWCRLIVESYTKNEQVRKTNKIGTFYTDKEKLPPDKALQDEENAKQSPF